MPTDFTLPELGENITAGDVVRVLVSPGDTVAKDQPVLELETDKATIEVPSSVAGTVKDVRVKQGERIKVGQVVLTIDDGGAAAPPKPGEPRGRRAPNRRSAKPQPQRQARRTRSKPQAGRRRTRRRRTCPQPRRDNVPRRVEAQARRGRGHQPRRSRDTARGGRIGRAESSRARRRLRRRRPAPRARAGRRHSPRHRQRSRRAASATRTCRHSSGTCWRAAAARRRPPPARCRTSRNGARSSASR